MTAPVIRAPAPAPGGDEVVVVLTSALLAGGPADLRWLLQGVLLSGARRIVVDLGEVDSVAGRALATLLTAHRICRARGGGVVLRGADPRTRDTLRRTGLWRVLHVQCGSGPAQARSGTSADEAGEQRRAELPLAVVP
ncbi:STAS domain-containing protein [Modestobacter versicolor]|uniref:Anti-anti-sigma factor n=1 Tax=Modestobacter versicolor TaxID=429133 RepID=A0A323VE31_9ACTN|nr:STAS domain-containing protein [Modestobacter versicolor]MBB3675187.1 anti-anti-sigma factor [Modestobacter versicolor]PZA22997.1 anti-sigma factor antagonist [Modestobacter versicolor]